MQKNPTRRNFLKTSALTTAAVAGFVGANRVYAGESSVLKIGLVGCGGRGCGAAGDAMAADENVKLVCMADIFEGKAKAAVPLLKERFGDRVAVTDDMIFTGFDAYQKVLEQDIDYVILATPQYFRPMMLKAAIAAGKHVFAEKPVAVDGAGIRMILEATAEAKRKKLNLVSGLCNRYQPSSRELVAKIQNGAIGEVVSAVANRMGGQLWVRTREEGDTEMRYQMRNWVNFCWMASEYINDVTIHQIDVALWCMGDPTPTAALGFGGRLARRQADTGDMYDAMAVTYEFEDGRVIQANSRQIPGAWGGAITTLHGSKGWAKIGNCGSVLEIFGENASKPKREPFTGYMWEHKTLIDAIRSGGEVYVNNGDYMANSTGAALLGRMAAYTGQRVTWEEMLAEELPKPESWSWDAVPPTLPNEKGDYKIAIPARGWEFM
ncbi:MAG: Gfo/Idh/MocA family oxidoreductase [Planctomycetia bacterium]|nr:Gfo/Idh/MocA family oxidoreductase [Planctomycetia bacterium]